MMLQPKLNSSRRSKPCQRTAYSIAPSILKAKNRHSWLWNHDGERSAATKVVRQGGD
ncbi:hypothetical protein SAMN05444171_0933 [Bradyrhizobium lablabi]|uniref:Uncharacterized protein n=2 Tax=Bradyrhizobium TaxID=374 RepID=A0ABY0Q8P3_9BRAD|nr:hypothetical protein SAMN05444163_6227 [Bradyrhizobium ottawaense]SEC22702.1 hypothetical protein SAMN05444171_0933 [Bradyrhizobium lablabi]